MPTSPARPFLWVLVGVLLVQAAWILVVPPFAGIDEHEHVFKAAAVAHGDLRRDHAPAPSGWGELVVVPRDLVEAASRECAALPLPDENCFPGAARGDGLVEVPSSAARYHPTYYAVVGPVSLPLGGRAALYAMRIASALLCALLVATAVMVTVRWSRTVWPAVAVVLALTPTTVYSTTVVAPNGIEVCAALTLWCALAGLVQGHDHPRRWLVPASICAVLLVSVRSVGPLWLALTCACLLPLVSRDRWRAIVRLRSAWLCAGLVLLATGSAVAWTLTAGTNDPPPGDAAGAVGSAWEALPGEFVLWWFQAVGAFPYRDEMASIWVYATLVPALGVLAALGARLAGARERWAMLLVVLASSAVPVVATLLTYERLGSAWQGRYGYPLALGFFVVCGLALDRYGLLLGQWWPVPVAVALACGAQLFGQLGVLRQQAATSPQAGTPAWWEPSPVLVAVLVLLGGLSLTAGLRGAGRRAIASSGGLAG